MSIILHVKYLDNYPTNNPLNYALLGDACVDLRNASEQETTEIFPGQRLLIPTGIKVSFPENHVMKIYPRSGLAVKKGLTLVNNVGIIDSSFRGEIGVGLINLSESVKTIKRGDRIAQFYITDIPTMFIVKEKELPESARGSGGFGHTGDA